MSTAPTPRTFDLVLFGASGFVGGLTAAYLAEHAPASARIALAGRSLEKLAKVQESLPAAGRSWELVQADSFDRAALAALAASTHVVATTVGPYAKFGLPLVEACADAGTHYADLTGEVLFMHETIDRFHERAQATGARIVHSCGFDSIPSDLGVFGLHRYAEAVGAGTLREARLVAAMGGAASGGTIDSMREQIARTKADSSLKAVVEDPYSLSPSRREEPVLGKQSDLHGVRRDPDSDAYLVPFVMAGVNTRVVRRSNALLGHAYGRSLRYSEAMRVGSGAKGAVLASGVLVALTGLVAGLTFGPTRRILDRILPKPGEGPSAEQRDAGYFHMVITADTSSGRTLRCEVKASGDPGYKATAVMLGEAALSLAFDGDALPDRAGMLTPATAMGTALIDRLQAAGHRYNWSEVGAAEASADRNLGSAAASTAKPTEADAPVR